MEMSSRSASTRMWPETGAQRPDYNLTFELMDVCQARPRSNSWGYVARQSKKKYMLSRGLFVSKLESLISDQALTKTRNLMTGCCVT